MFSLAARNYRTETECKSETGREYLVTFTKAYKVGKRAEETKVIKMLTKKQFHVLFTLLHFLIRMENLLKRALKNLKHFLLNLNI